MTSVRFRYEEEGENFAAPSSTRKVWMERSKCRRSDVSTPVKRTKEDPFNGPVPSKKGYLLKLRLKKMLRSLYGGRVTRKEDTRCLAMVSRQ